MLELDATMTKRRVAIVVSHPIQHFCPQYSSWSKIDRIDIRVFFASRHGLDSYHDKSFGRDVQWTRLSLDFSHEFLPDAAGKTIDARIDSDQLNAHLTGFNPDLVVAYGYAQPLQRRALAWAKKNGRCLAMIGDSELRAHRHWLKRFVKKFWLPHVLREVDVFLTVGDANESYYRNYGVNDRKLVRCFFPIDVTLFDTTLADREIVRARLRSTLGIQDNHVLVLMVGKLVSWKRQLDLVRFSNSIQPARRDITVILAGTGQDEEVLRATAAHIGLGGVVFAGFIPPENLVDYYAASDIYAHCSEVEPHSLAISEAIYSGLPVVVSDRCGSYGPSDDVRPGLNGLVYRCADSQELSGALLRLADNESLRLGMGRESTAIGRANQSLAHGKALIQAIEGLQKSGTVSE